MTLAVLVKLSFFQPTSFLPFTFLFPQPHWGRQHSSSVGLSCWLELKDDTLKTLTCQLKQSYTLRIIHSLLSFLTGKHLYGKLEENQHQESM